MDILSKIQWTTFTWNPWTGCNHVSPACDYCYAERTIEGRFGRNFKKVIRSTRPTFNKPQRLHKAITTDMPVDQRLVFTCSWSDFFHKQADPYRAEAWEIIRKCPNLIFQILTKRPERIQQCLPEDWGEGWPNVWIGTTVENQDTVHRIATLTQIPAVVRFVSFEPLLGPVSIDDALWLYSQTSNQRMPRIGWDFWDKKGHSGIDWAILGGESGNNEGKYLFRPMQMKWLEDLIRELTQESTAVFVKQLGTHLSKELGLKDRHGGDMEEFPENLRIRQLPIFEPQP
ncbi:DUF5131 family protein [Tellurirhabdus bombi]|uniref:DUF5131 family protein n=1 Tax=Tellurirhabdus bombi TaxID=2907205 RepID=UPI001F2F96B5|nr:DUF5131 family protein [Tellurirhabdus bombi]